MKRPMRVAVTGAAGQIGYSLLFRIASGEMLGKDQPVILQLLEIPDERAQKALKGVMMELDDCAFPLLHGMVAASDRMVAFKDVGVALLVGARPRGPGMERKDLLEANGKILLFNVPYPNYGGTVAYRSGGATMAAQHGAVAALVRAVGPTGLRTPHTGGMNYGDGVAKIPTAAIPVEDALRIQRLSNRGIKVRLRLKMEAHFEADVESFNVVGEIRGSEKPGEIVLVGGHFDSWDPGTGASDDGVGCVVTWEAARLMKKLNIRPKRTVRVVRFTNEENGMRGGNGYRDQHEQEAANHILAFESDSGVFAPASLGFSGSAAARQIISDIATLLTPLGLQNIGPGGGGADIGPIATLGKVPMMAYSGDSTKYFTIHHTPADTVDRIEPAEVSKAAAAIAAMIYVVAEMPQALPK